MAIFSISRHLKSTVHKVSPNQRLRHEWAAGAADQLLTLLQEDLNLDANQDGRGSLRARLEAVRAAIDDVLEAKAS